MKWTPPQKRAIESAGREIVVSAGAGSGKTAVLTERCLHLVMDAEPRTDLDQLLVVTFTEAAAAEMRSRIGTALRKRLTEESNSSRRRRLRQQLDLLDIASISTLHAFCRRLLVRHFNAAGVDPGFSLMDEHETALLRHEVFDRTLAELMATDAAERIRAFRRLYAAGSESRIRAFVLSLSAFLDSQIDPDGWCAAVLQPYEAALGIVLPEPWRSRRLAMMRQALTDLLAQLDEFLPGIVGDGVFEKFRTQLGAVRATIEDWAAALRDSRIASDRVDSIAASMNQFEFERAPSVRKGSVSDDDMPRIERLKSDREAFKKACSERFKMVLPQFTEAELSLGMQQTAPHVAIVIQMAQAYRSAFAEAKRRNHALDFSDLERFTLRLLTDNENTRHAVQRQYSQVLVDEVQDINPVQEAIIRAVSRDEDQRRNANLFSVGDVKQSIYRFRLAEPRLFVERQSQLADQPQGDEGLRIDLSENFRSQPAVLDGVNRLIRRIMTADFGLVDYDERAQLRYCGDEERLPTELPGIELHLIEKDGEASDDSTDEQVESDSHADADGDEFDGRDDAVDLEQIEREAVLIAERLHAIHAASPEGSWRDSVILLRSLARRAAPMVSVLTRMGIPAYTDRSSNLFDSQEYRDIRALLSLLDNRRQDIPYAAVLRSPLCTPMRHSGGAAARPPLSAQDLVLIRTHQREAPFHEAVANYAESGGDERLRESLAALSTQLDRWREMARVRPVAELLTEILAETGYSEFVRGLPDGAHRAAQLEALHEHARTFSRFARQSLHHFLRFLTELEAQDRDLSAGSTESGSADAVRIMSIHASKGLQFENVFVADLGKRFNLTDAREPLIFDRDLGIGLPVADDQLRVIYPSLPHRCVAERIVAEAQSEEVRLLYVALTRAVRRLVLVGTTTSKAVERMRDKNKIHADGPLPLSLRKRGICMLDWIMAATAAEEPPVVAWPQSENHTRRSVIEVYSRVGNSLAVASHDDADDARTQIHFEPLAELRPWSEVSSIPPDAAAQDDADRLLNGLEQRYSAEALVRIPSVVAVSDLKRRWESHDDPEHPAASIRTAHRAKPLMRTWRAPKFESAEQGPAATTRGTVTHLFLEHIDFGRSCTGDDLEQQCERIAVAANLSADDAAMIDLDAIAWFIAEPAGQQLQQFHTTLEREIPFCLRLDPEVWTRDAAAVSDEDFLITRGIIDCFYQQPDGIVVLDWKTDRVSGTALQERIDIYRGQLQIYSRALEEMYGAKVMQRQLVFLHARHVASV